MRRRGQQRGTVNNGFTLFLVAVMLCIGIAQSPYGGTQGGYFAMGVVLAGALWLAWRSGALPFIDAGTRAAVAGNLAQQLKGELTSTEVAVWGGGTATRYQVSWAGLHGRLTLQFGVAGISLGGAMVGAGTRAPPCCIVNVRRNAVSASGAGAAQVEPLLDDSVHAALHAIDALAKYEGALSLHVGEDSVDIHLQRSLGTAKARQFVDLGTPVIEKIITALSAQRS
jgi:hypothetical protein